MAEIPLPTLAEAVRQFGLSPSTLTNQVRAVRLRPLVLSTLADVAVVGLVALVLHEFFHFVTLQALGGSGYITFDWDSGRTISPVFPITCGQCGSAEGC